MPRREDPATAQDAAKKKLAAIHALDQLYSCKLSHTFLNIVNCIPIPNVRPRIGGSLGQDVRVCLILGGTEGQRDADAAAKRPLPLASQKEGPKMMTVSVVF